MSNQNENFKIQINRGNLKIIIKQFQGYFFFLFNDKIFLTNIYFKLQFKIIYKNIFIINKKKEKKFLYFKGIRLHLYNFA